MVEVSHTPPRLQESFACLIEVKNPKGKQRGVKKLLVDGKEIPGNTLPVSAPRSEPIRVEAVLEG